MSDNENLEFAYCSGVDSEPSSTHTDAFSDCVNEIYSLTSFQAPIRSSLYKLSDDVESADQVIFEVPPKNQTQKAIIFGKASHTNKEKCSDSEEEQKKLEFFHYDKNSCRIIKKMGYNLAEGRGLNFEKGRKTILQPFIPEGKTPDYYRKQAGGWDASPLSRPHQATKLRKDSTIIRQNHHAGIQMSDMCNFSRSIRDCGFRDPRRRRLEENLTSKRRPLGQVS